MSFSFKSLAETGQDISGHNYSEGGNPTGGYAISGSTNLTHYPPAFPGIHIRWQDGPIDREAGEKANGACVEDVLEVCRFRLEFYEASEYACEHNARAIEHIKAAVKALIERREDRKARGVLGKHEK